MDLGLLPIESATEKWSRKRIIKHYTDIIQQNGFEFIRIFTTFEYFMENCYHNDKLKPEKILTPYILYYIKNSLKSKIKVNEIPFDNFTIYTSDANEEIFYYHIQNANYTVMFLYSKYDSLLDYFIQKEVYKYNLPKHEIPKTIIYRPDAFGRQFIPSAEFSSKVHITGCDHIINSIVKLHENMRIKKDIYEKLGSSKGINVLLYSVPGCGKTSIIKKIAQCLKLRFDNTDFYIVDSENLAYRGTCLLTGELSKEKNGVRLIVLEDFDRLLNEEERGQKKVNMSDILNALDGITDSKGVIRFFTCNSLIDISNNKALFDRMTFVYKLEKPTTDIILEHYKKLFSEQEEQLIRMCQIINENNYSLTFRELNHMIVKYLEHDNPIEQFNNNFVNDMNQLQNIIGESSSSTC